MGWEVNHRTGMGVYVPEYFKVVEVFPPEMEPFFHENLVWLYIDSRVLVTMDRLRSRYGPAIMNTWGLSEATREKFGTHQWRGWRPRNCPVGAELSYHKIGSAVDMVFTDVSAETVRRELLENPFDETFQFVTSIEMTTNWFHFAVCPHDKVNNGVEKFYP